MAEVMGFASIDCRLPSILMTAVFVAAYPAVDPIEAGDLARPDNLETSTNGPLQTALRAEFPDAFTTGVDIFWELDDGWVTPEVLEWWIQHVEGEDREGINQEAAKLMFERIASSSPVFADRKRTICAVVGASGNLIGSQYGDLIDAHDLVIRFDRAPTAGYENDVGVRTTHHVTWPKPLDEGEYDRQAFLLMTPVSSNNPDVFEEILGLVVDRFEWDPDLVRIIHPEYIRHLHADWLGRRGNYPSMGFIALMIALHMCEEVNVFGFGADEQGAWDRYYDSRAVDASLFPAVALETELRCDLEARGLLKVFRGNRVEPGIATGCSGRD
jgi:hypothetical protein